MSQTPDQWAELRRLIHALHEKCITDEESARLEEWVCRDKEARRLYVRYMNLYASLRWRKMQEPPQEQEPSSNGKARTSRAPVLGMLGDVFQAGTDFLSRSFVLTVLLAIGLPAIMLVVLLVDIANQPVPTAPVRPVIAKVTESHRAVWGEGCAGLSVGARLVADQELCLGQGLAEVEFADGARVILEGPVRFSVARDGGFLREGRLTATVPPAAKGFTVQTPLTTVVDLGTEFGVSVGPHGASEAHVFVGQVEMMTKTTQGQPVAVLTQLDAGQAAKVRLVGANGRVKTEEMASVPDQFARRVPSARTEGLPEPKVVFAHHGDRDPATEGWRFSASPGGRPKAEGCTMSGIDDGGTAAWSIDDRSKQWGVGYNIMDEQGLTPELVARAKEKGWVLRARVKMIGHEHVDQGLSFFSYWDGRRGWRLRPTVDRNGDQCLFLFCESSLGEDATIKIPGSRGRYVDYEIRYHPKTDDADVYIDGKLAATACFATQRSKRSLHFGTLSDMTSDARFAELEWGILEETSE